jgi:uncharacterized protein YndB with AHSA1/START domain
MNNEPFIIERTFNAPAAKVWKAITNKNEMKHWYFDVSDFRPEVGFEFHFYGGDENNKYLHLCKITEVVPGKKLSYTWRYDNIEGVSHLTFELFDEGNKTRLRLTHAGLETFKTNDPNFAKESFAAGWTEIIGTMLKEFVERSAI